MKLDWVGFLVILVSLGQLVRLVKKVIKVLMETKVKWVKKAQMAQSEIKDRREFPAFLANKVMMVTQVNLDSWVNKD